MKKTKEQLEVELALKEAFEGERDKSDKRYAVKLVELIVYSLCATGFLAMAAYIAHKLLEK